MCILLVLVIIGTQVYDCLVGDPNTDILSVSSFNYDAFDEILDEVTDITCPGMCKNNAIYLCENVTICLFCFFNLIHVEYVTFGLSFLIFIIYTKIDYDFNSETGCIDVGIW